MQFRPENRGEALGPERHRVHDRIAVHPDEMIGQRQKIIAFGAIAAAHLFRRQHPVRPGGMGVQIAAPETAGGSETLARNAAKVRRFPEKTVLTRS
jgi:hypothetical protein